MPIMRAQNIVRVGKLQPIPIISDEMQIMRMQNIVWERHNKYRLEILFCISPVPVLYQFLNSSLSIGI
jgi:hypothetical protein